ncbi:DUF2946 family protein [Methylovirgula ligni]|uniref:DUF2946 family protein n=1 Tax=Methylovirgula ligni TaxID=569860 RepID=A0A3D9YYB1_9HYPH|nr:DUF2946 family protein [Methylovirgula ligni]REF87641.1 DUF2946 family protein [Methylovirgula ligni]
MLGRIADTMTALGGRLRAKAAAGRQFVAGLAILGLYLQLAAGAFCTAGLPSSGNFGSFPICHTASGDQGSVPKPDRAPQQQQQSCAFCALHCHLAVILPPALPIVALIAGAWAAQLARATAQPRLYFAIAAQPRGPPHLS